MRVHLLDAKAAEAAALGAAHIELVGLTLVHAHVASVCVDYLLTLLVLAHGGPGPCASQVCVQWLLSFYWLHVGHDGAWEAATDRVAVRLHLLLPKRGLLIQLLSHRG